MIESKIILIIIKANTQHYVSGTIHLCCTHTNSLNSEKQFYAVGKLVSLSYTHFPYF